MTSSVGTRATTASKVRVPFWDNARVACIVLVVLGHALQRMSRDSDPAYGVYLLIYTFHMPAFAIMSGYFSRAGEPTRKQMSRVFTDIIAPYLIFETLWSLLSWALYGKLTLNYATASWTLWFLLALAAFRIILPYLALLRWPVTWTLLVSVTAGYIPAIDGTLAMNRILQLMPFFVIGWWLKERRIVERFGLLEPRVWARAASGALLVGVGVSAWLFADVLRGENVQRWFFFKQTYDELSLPGGAEPGAWGGVIRLGVIALALLMCAAFFAVVPRGEYRWTSLGQYTLYVYLLHTFVLFPMRETNGADGRNITIGLAPDWLWLILFTVGSIAVTLLLSSRPVRWLTRPFVEPPIGALLSRDVR